MFAVALPKKITCIYLMVMLLGLFGWLPGAAQTFVKPVQDSGKKVQTLVVPFALKTPEMGWGGGLSASVSFKTSFRGDSLTRTSVIQAIGFYTQNKQNVQALDASIFFPKENYILLLQASHNYFPDKFWGIGPHTSDQPWERYTYEHLYASPHLKKRVYRRLFAGVLYEVQNVFRVNYSQGGVFDTSRFYGKSKYLVSGPGLSFSFDSRNKTFWPEKGIYLLAQTTRFTQHFASDYDLTKLMLDLRYYKRVYKHQILALQLYSYQTFGNTPLRDLGSLGGSNNMRGFYQGRFRANNVATLIAEYRIPVYRRWSACLFGGMGTVYNTPQVFAAGDLKYSYGGGIRFSLLEKEKLNLRLDYGYSNKFNSGFYFTVGECF